MLYALARAQAAGIEPGRRASVPVRLRAGARRALADARQPHVLRPGPAAPDPRREEGRARRRGRAHARRRRPHRRRDQLVDERAGSAARRLDGHERRGHRVRAPGPRAAHAGRPAARARGALADGEPRQRRLVGQHQADRVRAPRHPRLRARPAGGARDRHRGRRDQRADRRHADLHARIVDAGPPHRRPRRRRGWREPCPRPDPQPRARVLDGHRSLSRYARRAGAVRDAAARALAEVLRAEPRAEGGPGGLSRGAVHREPRARRPAARAGSSRRARRTGST